MDIGQIIKQRREELGISQEELAQKAGYKSRSSINKIEVDGRGLPQSKITAIAKALKTTPAFLMGWDETENITLGESAKEMLHNFQKLNDYGQKEALKRVSEMIHIPQYSKTGSVVQPVKPDPRSYLQPVAAHERTDIEVTEEMKQYDDAFFDE